MSITSFRIVCAAILLVALSVPAAADFILTNNSGSAVAKTDYGPGSFLSPQTVTTTFGPFGGVALSHLDMRSFGDIRAVQTGYGINAVGVEARVGDIPFFDWSARTKYDVEVAQDDPLSHVSLDFEYHLNGGRLALYDPAGKFDGSVATVGVSIFTISPGFSGFLWSWTLSMRGSQGIVTPTIDFLIDPLNFGVPSLSAVSINNGVASLDIGDFIAGTNLGVLSGSQTAFVSYDMDATVYGVGYNATGGVARLGDPLNTNGNYGAGITLNEHRVAAPEPSSMILVLIGLAASCRIGRSARRQR